MVPNAPKMVQNVLQKVKENGPKPAKILLSYRKRTQKLSELQALASLETIETEA